MRQPDIVFSYCNLYFVLSEDVFVLFPHAAEGYEGRDDTMLKGDPHNQALENKLYDTVPREEE